MLKKIALAALCGLSLVAQAGDVAYEKLLAAKTIRCTFDKGYRVDWKKDGPKLKEANTKELVTFDAIDSKTGTAKEVSGATGMDVKTLITGNGIVFTKQFETGSMIFTTVYAYTPKNKVSEYAAVTSRHMAVTQDFPTTQQIFGLCTLTQ